MLEDTNSLDAVHFKTHCSVTQCIIDLRVFDLITKLSISFYEESMGSGARRTGVIWSESVAEAECSFS